MATSNFQLPLMSFYQAIPVWGGHQGHPPNLGWLFKANFSIEQDGSFFVDPSSCLQLGLSRLMGKSMLFWAEAFKLIESLGGGLYQTSDWAQQLFGADPHLESSSVLWLLHWKLCRPPCLAIAWEWFFSYYYQTGTFTEHQIHMELLDWLTHQRKKIPAGSTIGADLRLLLKMYAQGLPDSVESEFFNPMPQLGLICNLSTLDVVTVEPPRVSRPTRGKGKSEAAVSMAPRYRPTCRIKHPTYEVVVGNKPMLGWQVISFCMVDLLLDLSDEQIDWGRISLHDLLYSPHGVGIILKIKESQFHESLDILCKEHIGYLTIEWAERSHYLRFPERSVLKALRCALLERVLQR